MKIHLRCSICGALRSVPKSQASGENSRYRLRDGIYLCRPCWNGKRKGRAFNPPRVKKIEMRCSKCGVARETYETEMAKRKNQERPYLCRKCYLLLPKEKKYPHYDWAGEQGHKAGEKVEVPCPDCGKMRLYRKSSALKAINKPCLSCKNKGERSPSWNGGKTVLFCAGCGKNAVVSPSAVQKRTRKTGEYYCRSCGVNNKPTGQESATWRGGKSFEPYPVQWNNGLRKRIRERDANACQLCGNGGTSRRMPVHHIDYDKGNLKETNLITLCGKCHPKTNYRRDHWQSILETKMREITTQEIKCQPS